MDREKSYSTQLLKGHINPVLQLKFCCIFFVLFFLPQFLSAQANLGRQTILKFDVQNSVLQPKAEMLEESLPMELAKNNASFVGSVGGVSFDQIAVPDPGLQVNEIQLFYNGSQPNGKRLQLMINNQIVNVDLPDWQLIPISNYADSPNFSCVTIFGQLDDELLARNVARNKGRVINYHIDFYNTLLGVRLLYMDMLIGYNFTSDLPKNDKGEYILGLGEHIPNVRTNKNGAYDLSRHFTGIQEREGITFRSYVITDYTQTIKFGITNDSLVLSGNPYYYCWRYKNDVEGYDVKKVEENYRKKLSTILATKGSSETREYLISQLLELGRKYKGNYNFYSGGTFVSMVNMKNDVERMMLLERYATLSLKEMVYSTEALMDSYTVLELKSYSDAVSSRPELFEKANPEVWYATQNVMRYAALFRYIKNRIPSGWKAYMQQIETIDPEPRIFTPTMMYPSVFEDYFNKK